MIDQKVIELYNEYKDKILNQINIGYGLNHRGDNHVGIINLGATCHLNSLLQVLYHNKPFRQLIYSAYLDNKDSIILAELSLLFALLDKSISSTISAKDLTIAFGWNRSQTGSQQCSFELLNVLLEALQQTSTFLDEGIKKLFKGTICNLLLCKNCNYSSKRMEDYYYLTLNPPPKSNQKMRTLEEIIKDSFFNKEIVDWKCSQCNENVQAYKYEEILSLPDTLIIHLNRLNFDYETMRRQKLTFAMSFPNKLLSKRFFNNNNDNDDDSNDLKLKLNDSFEFDSCIIHSGSAAGGHYKSLTRDNDVIYECNDGHVVALSNEEVNVIFNPVEDIVSKKHSLVHENGYIFTYSRKTNEPENTSIPDDIMVKVEDFNNNLSIIQKLYHDVHQGILGFHVSLSGFNEYRISSLSSLSIEIHNDATLKETLHEILHKLKEKISNDNDNDDEKKLIQDFFSLQSDRIRICKLAYNSSSSRITETFGGKENSSLKELGFTTNSHIMIQHRKDDDDKFQEIRPGDMTLRILLWNADMYQSGSSIEELYHKTIVLKAEKDPTLGQLKIEVQSALQLNEEKFKAAIIYHNDCQTILLSGSNNSNTKYLRRDFKICLIDDILVEVIPKDMNDEDSSSLSILWNEKNSIKLLFTDPNSTSNQSIMVPIETTLLVLKQMISKMINIDINDFYICRSNSNTNSNSLKEDGKTIRDYGLLDQSFIFIKLGKQAKKGEIMLIFEYIDEIQDDESIFKDNVNTNSNTKEKTLNRIILGEQPISEKLKVLELKKIIYNVIIQSSSTSHKIKHIPTSFNHIRLRDIRKPNEFLRNDRILNRAMLGLADGRKILCQYLTEPEVIEVNDIVVNVRLLSCTKLSKSIDMIINKSISVSDLYKMLFEKFKIYHDNGMMLSIAKGFNSGPPLTYQSASKLSWNNGTTLINNNSTIDMTPLTIRDGSLIIITFDDINIIKENAFTKDSNNTRKKVEKATVPEKALKITINNNNDNNDNKVMISVDDNDIVTSNELTNDQKDPTSRKLQREFEAVRL